MLEVQELAYAVEKLMDIAEERCAADRQEDSEMLEETWRALVQNAARVMNRVSS